MERSLMEQAGAADAQIRRNVPAKNDDSMMARLYIAC